MANAITALRHTGIELSLGECYRLCGIPDPARKVEKAGNREITPPESPKKEKMAPAKIGRKTPNQGTIHASNKYTNTVTVAEQPVKGQYSHHGSEGSIRYSDLSDCPSDLSDGGVEDQVSSLPISNYQLDAFAELSSFWWIWS